MLVFALLVGCTPVAAPQTPQGEASAAASDDTAAEPTTAAVLKFVIASDATFPPMEMVDENKQIVGFDIDLINAIAKASGFEVEIKNTAWDGIFAGLESGDYDAIISSVSITDERQAKYDFTEPYINAGQVVVVRVEDTAITSEKDLPGKTAGAQIGTTGALAIDKMEGVVLKEYDTIDLAFQDLLMGAIDAVVVDTPVAAQYVLTSATFKGKFKIVGEAFTEEYYGVLVRKGDNAEFLKLFNDGLAKIKADGTYDAIYAKWIQGE
ncbi:MAG: basic amino acid ABC transporter substrate-binding protein [Chloroflexi bacterium]|nr:basic amino acid ABC transporter substrate-binding protein [Chloroflexota bacterium]